MYQTDSSHGRRGVRSQVFLALAETHDTVLNILRLFEEKSEGVAS